MTGLRGCFAYVHIADPNNRIYESNEDNNEAQVIIRLPFHSGDRRAGLPGPDRGRRYPRLRAATDRVRAHAPRGSRAPSAPRRARA